MAEEIERYRAKVSFQQKFENLSQRPKDSTNFFARNIPFYLQVCREEERRIICFLVWPRTGYGHSLNVKFVFSFITPSKTFQSSEFSCTINCEHYFQKTVLSEIFPAEEIIVDDIITLEISLWAEEPQGIDFNPPKEKLRQDLQIAGKQETSDALASLLDSGDFSDLTFVVNEDSSNVKAHKNILAARSNVFATMLTTDMREAKDNEIRIDDMGALALKIMLRHIYSGQLLFPEGIEIDLKICQELANAGEKYDLQKLKEYAAMAMTEFVSLDNGWELLAFGKRLKAKAATKALASYIAENVDKIMEKE